MRIRPLGPGWTPVTALRALRDRPYPFFLDSAGGPAHLACRSIVGCDPFLVVHAKEGDATLFYPREGRREKRLENAFRLLHELLERYRTEERGPFPLAPGGVVGYLSYDLFPQVEKIERRSRDDLGMPDLFLAFYDSAVVFDMETGGAFLAENEISGPPPSSMARFLSAPPREEEVLPEAVPRDVELIPNQPPEAFLDAVRRAREYIAAGDVYQVNLSQRFEAPLEGDPLDFYLKLRRLSPAPFGACLFPDNFAVLSNSPERYLLIDGDYIETRPIKGTRPRGRTAEEDEGFCRELIGSTKDAAEHVMIVDLERNDLGRVAAYRSVHVPEFRVVESYANVHHLVSTVAGRVHPSFDVAACIRNSFPGGSITGAPKVRSMEIIDELEPTSRGVYCGSIGFIDFSGRADLNIAIRTAVFREGRIYFQVGGGIVYDSDPQEEYEETITKAQSFLKTLTGKGRVWNG